MGGDVLQQREKTGNPSVQHGGVGCLTLSVRIMLAGVYWGLMCGNQ